MSKDLLTKLRDESLTEYGSTFSGEMVREVLGVEYPEYGTKKQFDDVVLVELSAIGYVRDILRKEGKHIAQNAGIYRVCLPSENESIARSWESQADDRMKRAQQLRTFTPLDAYDAKTDRAVIVAMKRESLNSRFCSNEQGA